MLAACGSDNQKASKFPAAPCTAKHAHKRATAVYGGGQGIVHRRKKELPRSAGQFLNYNRRHNLEVPWLTAASSS